MRATVVSHCLHTVCLGLALAAPVLARGQAPPPPDAARPGTKDGTDKIPRLFQSESPLAVTFTTNLRRLRTDRSAESPWRWAMIRYQDSAGKSIDVPVRARTRGIWRLRNCEFPPVRLNFTNEHTRGTLFHDLDEPKLVNYCRNTTQQEQYILQELQLYRIYRLLTPVSHRVRLLKVSYADSSSGKGDIARFGFIVEDPAELARRIGGTPVKLKGAGPDHLDHAQLALTYMFEYLIGNTDFSFSGLHNTELVQMPDGRTLPIAYDFDFSGAVNTTYATPDPSLRMRSVRERRFRASCAIRAEFASATALLIQHKEAIYALYRDEIGKLLQPAIVRETLAYFDEFYHSARSPESAESDIYRNCVGPS